MKTKTLIFILGIILINILVTKAQPGDKIQSLRIAIYTEELQLTSDEAKVFWPIFNEYSQKVQKLKNELKQERTKYGAIKNLSNTEAMEAINKFLEYEQKELDLRKEYMNKLAKVIPPQKILKIHRAEARFKKALLEQLKQTMD